MDELLNPHSTETLAYVAGLFDGEGSVSVALTRPNRYTNGRTSPRYDLRIKITNTHQPVIDWLKDTFGGGVVYAHARSEKRVGVVWRPAWTWKLMGRAASQFLQWILPYLKIKPQQAILAIEFQEFSDTHLLYLPANRKREVLERSESYRQRIGKLNRPLSTLKGIDDLLGTE